MGGVGFGSRLARVCFLSRREGSCRGRAPTNERKSTSARRIDGDAALEKQKKTAAALQFSWVRACLESALRGSALMRSIARDAGKPKAKERERARARRRDEGEGPRQHRARRKSSSCCSGVCSIFNQRRPTSKREQGGEPLLYLRTPIADAPLCVYTRAPASSLRERKDSERESGEGRKFVS